MAAFVNGCGSMPVFIWLVAGACVLLCFLTMKSLARQIPSCLMVHAVIKHVSPIYSSNEVKHGQNKSELSPRAIGSDAGELVGSRGRLDRWGMGPGG